MDHFGFWKQNQIKDNGPMGYGYMGNHHVRQFWQSFFWKTVLQKTFLRMIIQKKIHLIVACSLVMGGIPPQAFADSSSSSGGGLFSDFFGGGQQKKDANYYDQNKIGDKYQNTVDGFDDDDPMAGQFKEAAKKCNEAAKGAENKCNNQTNPNSQQATQQQQGASNMPGSTPNQNCNAMAALLPMLTGLLKAFQGDCSSGQGGCKSACNDAKNGASKCSGVTDKKKQQACMKNAKSVKEFGDQAGGNCDNYGQNLGAIAALLATVALAAATMQNCQQNSTQVNCQDPNSATNPNYATQCAPAKNCNVPSSYANDPAFAQQCQCQSDPRGCNQNTNTPADATASHAGTSGGSSPPSSPGGSQGATDPTKPLGGGGGGNLPGSPAGGDSTSNKPPAGKGQDGAATKPAELQVNAGDYNGTGGSNGKFGSGYPESPLPKGKGKMSQFVLRRQPAGAASGAAGRSNWEKVNDCYHATRPSLIFN
ncbi:MAG: hypothetical protein C5B49_14230 [Bdellovibrio sp.]|nr:MAG: hypothetical protein C5B49_14230 [Bdellovibrio sp.]